MQTNFNTIKITRKPKQQETTTKHVKTAYKGKQWKRGTDKREMYNYALEGR
jgi:hypothetical protein